MNEPLSIIQNIHHSIITLVSISVERIQIRLQIGTINPINQLI